MSLENLLHNIKCENIESVLENFFIQYVPLSLEIIKLKKKKKFNEALNIIREKEHILINECFYSLSNIILAILKGKLKIEHIDRKNIHDLIYIWFTPLSLNDKSKSLYKLIIEFHNKLIENENIYNKINDDVLTFDGIYFSEWIILTLNKIFNSLISEEEKIQIENWTFVIDLMKFVYVDKNIILEYLQKENNNVLFQYDIDNPHYKIKEYNYDEKNINVHHNMNNINNSQSIFSNEEDRSHFECSSKSLFRNILKDYYKNPHKVTKIYFSFPHVFFKCIINGLKDEDVKRKIYIYNHIIPKELNEDGFYKNIITTCVLCFFHMKQFNDIIDYEKVIFLLKKIINLNLTDTFSSVLFHLLLNPNMDKEKRVDESDKDINNCNIMKDENKKNCQLKKKINYTSNIYMKGEFTNIPNNQINYVLNTNYIIENIFYYLHLYSGDEKECKILLTSLLKELNPFIKLIEDNKNDTTNSMNNKLLYICIYNEKIYVLLNILINIIFLYSWNYFFIERFFNPTSKHCFGLCYAICIIDIINHIIYDDSLIVWSLFKNFEMKKKKILMYISRINVEECAKKSYIELINEMDEKSNMKGELQELEKASKLKEVFPFEDNENILEENKIELILIKFLQDIFIYILNNFNYSLENMGGSEDTFFSILLSKLLYTFSIHLKDINKMIVSSCYNFEILSKRELYLYKINMYNIQRFDNITKMIQHLFQCNNEVSLYCGQIIAEYFKKYMTSHQMVKKKKNKNKKINKIKIKKYDKNDECDENSKKNDHNFYTDSQYNSSDNSDDEKVLFPNLKKPLEYIPKDVLCFKTIEQCDILFLENFILSKEDIKTFEKDEYSIKRMDDVFEFNENVINNDEYLNKKDQISKFFFKGSESSLDLIHDNNYQHGCDVNIIYDDNMKNKDKKHNKNNDTLINTSYYDVYKNGDVLASDDMIKHADNIIDNDMYNLEEKEFVAKLLQENEYYLNMELNKNMYIDPSEDLFECLNRLNSKVNYIERNNIEDNNEDILRLDEKNENYEEANFRLCQTIIVLPKLIKECDILSYISVDMYKVLFSINNITCNNKNQNYIMTYKLFAIVLLCIHNPIEICTYMFNNIYNNTYDNIQKMLMILCFQLTALYLSSRIKLDEIYEYIKNIHETMNISEGLIKSNEMMDNKTNDKINLLDTYSKNMLEEINHFDEKKKKINTQKDYVQAEEKIDSCSIKKNINKSCCLVNKKKIQKFTDLCNIYFSGVYTTLFCFKIKKGMSNIDYDEYRMRKYYSENFTLTTYLLSSYNTFLNCCNNIYIYLEDIIRDGICLVHVFIQRDNLMIRRACCKLLYDMINLIFCKKMFNILNNPNNEIYEYYENVMNYISNRIKQESDSLSFEYMKQILSIYQTINI
ncbi:hypothetical protein PGSY75_0907100 [Plasmodium gaboni]|uniref:Telomere length regulation protein conserved domain-containing protein n=1 Tax=Plasmodium gaboni TaxID=647221 RepID=A0A151LLE7_9APIC|nr:hypothetical protein PGSY75_0907100 [Plasmodium gaboni]KYO00060.1 hypothetical protein PGSY75_0907100 [Plasmodium gaboni]